MEVEKNLRMDSNTDKLETRSTTTPLSTRRGVGGEVELRSEEVQEILSRPPHALIRYGISVITGVLFVIFIGSFFFRYPDIVNGEVIITTENPPIWLVAKSTGRISEISCADAQIVKQGTILGIIENPATTKDILLVRDLLKDVVINEGYCLIADSLLTSSFELGSVQNSFSSFIRAAVNYNNFLTLNLSNQDKLSLEKQIQGLRELFHQRLDRRLHRARAGRHVRPGAGLEAPLLCQTLPTDGRHRIAQPTRTGLTGRIGAWARPVYFAGFTVTTPRTGCGRSSFCSFPSGQRTVRDSRAPWSSVTKGRRALDWLR